MRGTVDVADLARRIVAGERRALARGITLVESLRKDDQASARALLDLLLPHTGRALRVGISGTPGVGKSTFIEAMGSRLLDDGKKIAVLAVDPSSPTTGGSILGDKTRMERLAHDDRAFVRPSPSGGALGGIASRTREAMLLCEAAGFDVVLIETVGVGQSEHAVSAITDTFLLLVAPGGGDDLQGQKRGILELVHIVVVHKASWPGEELIVRGTLSDIKQRCRDAGIVSQAMVLASPTLGARHWPDLVKSKLYDPGFTHRFRKACA